MLNILNAIRDTLRVLREIMISVAKLGIVIRHYPILFVLLIGLISALAIGYYFSYEHPQRYVSGFYEDISGNRRSEAWLRISDTYQLRWKHNPGNFERGYKTTIAVEKLSVTPDCSAINPFRFLTEDTISYIVSYEASDRFSTDDTKDPTQTTNLQWLSLAHPNDFPKLRDGSLASAYNDDNATLVMVRFYKSRITLKKRSFFDYEIANISPLRVGIAYRQNEAK